MKRYLLWGAMTALVAGCGSISETASELEPLPTTLLPASPYQAAMTAAPAAAEYKNLAQAGFLRWNDNNGFRVGFTHYFKPVQNQPGQPIGLHEFLQHQDKIAIAGDDTTPPMPISSGGLMFMSGTVAGNVRGRYNVMPVLPVGIGFSFGENYFQFDMNASYYFKEDLAAGFTLNAGDAGTNFYPFCKWATRIEEQALYLEGGFRIWDNGDDGVFIKAEFFFTDYISGGIYFSTDALDQIVGTFAYQFDNGFGVTAEIGSQFDNFFLQIGGEYRFP